MFTTFIAFSTAAVLLLAFGIFLGFVLRMAFEPEPSPNHSFSVLRYEGGPTIRGQIMAFELRDDQAVTVTAAPVDRKGAPAPIQAGSAKWSSSDETVATVTPDEANELSATVKAVGIGVATISVTADADPSVDIDTEIGASGEVAVVGGQAEGFAPLIYGAPTAQV